jgi:hypothetical protein
MNTVLRKLAFFSGLGILVVSMFWSQDGFNFEMAGDSGYGQMAIVIGWFLAVVVSVIQFVFSSNYKELNPSLIFFGILAYGYSIYTNYQGILHFQGSAQSVWGARVLAMVMDGVAEPLIAWGLYESRTGDFIGNLIRTVVGAPEKIQSQNVSQNSFQKNVEKPQPIHNFSPELLNKLGENQKNSGNQPNLHRVKNNHHRFE